jgi:hypothetical protein
MGAIVPAFAPWMLLSPLQWGPPIIGGSTTDNDPVMTYCTWPQWSPPITGGNTGTGYLPQFGDIGAPQSSPSVIDGSTPPAGQPAHLHDRATWSPPITGGSTRSRSRPTFTRKNRNGA